MCDSFTTVSAQCFNAWRKGAGYVAGVYCPGGSVVKMRVRSVL